MTHRRQVLSQSKYMRQVGVDEETNGRKARRHTIEVKAPSPGNPGGKGTTNDGAQGSRNGPGCTKDGVVHWSFPADS